MVEVHLAGVFPRSEKLIGATRAAERGNLPEAEVDKVLNQDINALVQLEQDSHLDSIVDGQLNWQDLFRPFNQLLTGLGLGSLTRWFDNNSFYRKPIIVEKVAVKSNDLQQYFRSDLMGKVSHKKAILPGPFTLAHLSENKAYSSLADLVTDLGRALGAIAAALQEKGYEYFQFNEPSICAPGRTKAELQIAKRAYEACVSGIRGKSIIQTYFGDASQVIASLLDYPVDAIGIDFYATSIDSLKEYDFNKVLGCGCVDGRNSLLESPRELMAFVSRARESLEPADIHLTPNCDLDFLPETVAAKKVQLLGETRSLVA